MIVPRKMQAIAWVGGGSSQRVPRESFCPEIHGRVSIRRLGKGDAKEKGWRRRCRPRGSRPESSSARNVSTYKRNFELKKIKTN